MNIKSAKKIHMVGVKGVGMTALAQILANRDIRITGSDGKEKFFTDKVLKESGIRPKIFSPKNISKDIDLVISSAAYFSPGKKLGQGSAIKNKEVERALKVGIPVFSYPQALAQVAKDYEVIAVAGSHGKSTTSAMLAWALEQSGKSPSAVIGTRVNGWGSNGRVGNSKYLVIEADEYREAFLNYKPFGVVVTNIDYDHPDYYKSEVEYNRAFKRLIGKVKKGGFVVGFGDDPEVAALLQLAKRKKLKTSSYGFLKKNNVVLEKKEVPRSVSRLRGEFTGKQMFHALFHGKKMKGKLMFAGKHYIENAGAVIACSKFLFVDAKKMLKGLASFKGTARRFEVLQKKPAVIVDDYAHHPTEIRATLRAARELYSKKNIVAIFQPHMFSRTESLMENFAKAFDAADEVGIMEIFSSARESKGKVSSRDLANEVSKNHSNVRYFKDKKSAKKFLTIARKRSKNVILLMGAGDVYEIA